MSCLPCMFTDMSADFRALPNGVWGIEICIIFNVVILAAFMSPKSKILPYQPFISLLIQNISILRHCGM